MIGGIKTLFLAISCWITSYIYPAIPRLYNVFLYFANYKFLDNDLINKIWNNIYVLVGVIVMFAIAIKLISAIVNPDVLDKNKKSAKFAYLRAVIAVVLIFLAPIVFETMTELQNKLLDSNSILTKITGVNISDEGLGQDLAWETFSSFCTPVITETGVSLGSSGLIKNNQFNFDANNNQLGKYYFAAVNIDVVSDITWFDIYLSKTVYNLFTLINAPMGGDIVAGVTGSPNVGFEYHAILCPLAGLLVAYELLLLCMDTAFRVFKLTFLQVMFPIVLGAFVFDTEILKKWAKEYFSTFLSVFLKIIAFTFILLAIKAFRGGAI